MLRAIKIAGQATYASDGQHLDPCKQINFIFGTNGSGKTTISRVIADPAANPTCELSWANGRELERLVYNSDFVDNNFKSTVKGIFTLGEESAETLENIDKAKDTQHKLQEGLANLQNKLTGANGDGGVLGDLKKLRRAFEEMCWSIKGRHEAHFQEAFEGLRNSKARFCDRVLLEQEYNTSAAYGLDDLKTRAKSVFQKGLIHFSRIDVPSFSELIQLEEARILGKRVVGKEDVNVSALIERLGNSDWVKQGRTYLDQSGGTCPFCQQQLQNNLARDLNDYFDESFARDLTAIERLQSAYDSYSASLLKRLGEVAATEGSHLSVMNLESKIDRLAQRIQLNMQLIARKKSEPSAIVALASLADVAAEIVEQLKAANVQITGHNELVDNIAAERKRLIAEAWRYVLDENKADIERYLEDKAVLDRNVSSINTAIEVKKAQLASVTREIAALERSITSVEPTVTEINAILASFGFTSFRLATAGDLGSLYKLVRHDGSDALKTLSEGEKSFITFLYFYHLIRGSVSSSGMSADRVIVFDDPVSSLDSDVLFIVSTLIKRVLEDACAGNSLVKQVFVLTHNIYFHKEVTYDAKRQHGCRLHETFWIVRKQENVSLLAHYDHNPIKTSYELLWSQVRDADRTNITIQNTLRRILESYFKLLGNMDRDEIVAMFEGRDKQICASLFSWVNDGSHAVHDDLYISADGSVVERYLTVFKQIFEKTKHMGHYCMMMRTVPDASFGAPLAAEGASAAA
ncbi:MAG: AAA family ATPase [Hyphomicrobium sp.]|uniref:AAA family ATPase n=1 Tax=Hyphomicrobium sp. TaxID=82 RepID=UPI00356AB47C